jgi:hypothetical protein
MSLPARSWVVLKADKQFTPSLSAKKQLSITLNPPAPDYNTAGWVGVNATVPGRDFETVTFSVRQVGKPWISIGSTDRRTFAAIGTTGGLFRTFLHQQNYKNGTILQVVATVKDALGNIATSKVLKYTVSYTG